jgi:hypothetical protein
MLPIADERRELGIEARPIQEGSREAEILERVFKD